MGYWVRMGCMGIGCKARDRFFFVIDYTDCWPKHNRYKRFVGGPVSI